MTRFHLLFAIMSFIWGLTWIAIKTGVDAVPPFFFAASRILVAGLILLVLAYRKGALVSPAGHVGRLVLAGLLVNTATYGLLFWGMQYVPSGISAVVNLALIPVGLFTMGVVAGEETFTGRKLAAIALGVFGLGVLFLPKLSAETELPALQGMMALVVGTLAYCWGSILSRPLFDRYRPTCVSAFHMLVGGSGLLFLALLYEPIDLQTLNAYASPRVLLSWLFLVLGGSVAAFTIYLGLLRDWGPSRAGLYAFVSPVVALALGVALFDEQLGAYELAGSVIMLFAAGLAMRRPA